jgi:hypothetical protein
MTHIRDLIELDSPKEYFCGICGYNYNRDESIFEFYPYQSGDIPHMGYSTCPKCVNDETINSMMGYRGKYVYKMPKGTP